MLGLVATLVNNPFFFSLIKVSLKVAVIFTYHALHRVIVPISNIVSAFRNFSWALNVVGQQCESIRSQSAFTDFCVELSIFVSAVLPLFKLFFLLLLAVDVLKIVVEKIFSVEEFSPVPFGDITALICNAFEYLLHSGR